MYRNGIREQNKIELDAAIFEAFKKTYGNVMQSADLIGAPYQTLYLRIATEPLLRKALYEAREGIKFNRSDFGEQVIDRSMKMIDTNPGQALRAAIYHLETHAKDRGYGKINEQSYGVPNDPELDKDHENMMLKNQIAKMKGEDVNISEAG
jgi:hypothetical protein